MDYAAIELRQRIVAIKRSRILRLAAKRQEDSKERRKWKEAYWVDPYRYSPKESDAVFRLKVGCQNCRYPDRHEWAKQLLQDESVEIDGIWCCPECSTPLAATPSWDPRDRRRV